MVAWRVDVDVCVVGCVELVTWRVDVVSGRGELGVESGVSGYVESWVPGYVESDVDSHVESGGVPRNLI